MEQTAQPPKPLELRYEAVPASVTAARKRAAEYARNAGAELIGQLTSGFSVAHAEGGGTRLRMSFPIIAGEAI